MSDRMSAAANAVSAEEALEIATREHEQAARNLAPDARVLFGLWGAAWGIGFAALWLTDGDEPRIDLPTVGWIVFGVSMIGALVGTGIHIGRRVHGVHGRSAVMGRRYSAAWVIAFAAYGALMSALGATDASDEVLSLLSPLLACLIVGLMYMAAGALWEDSVQFLLGAWITVAVGIAAIVGVPNHLLVMSVLGGGGFLIGALMARWRSAHT